MKCFYRCSLAVFGIALLLAFALAAGLSFAGKWLANQDRPEKADAILILAGDPARAFYAADLYAQGYAAKIYVSRPVRLPSQRLLDDLRVPFPRYEEIDRQVLIKKGVPDKSISILPQPATSTVDEAIGVARLLEGKKVRLLVITSPYHVRRARMVFGDLLPNTEIRIVATPYEVFPAQWWKNQDAARNMVLELSKILFYLAGGRFHAAGPAS
jgi:uncharacterized SAM-binding protein YcdF (DUF218 family)